MLHLMQISKVYIDFGNHPGKDRIPREAAICGCCIITGKRGSANNKIDIAIKDKYKFEDRLSSIDQIHSLICDCMDNFDICQSDFKNYREIILKEEAIFKENVLKIFEKM